MNRRQFFSTAAVATVSVSTAPRLLGMTRKSANEHPVIGVDGFKFECHHNWGTLPGELEWQTTHNVAVDHNGHVYITHQGHKGKKGLDTVMVFDDKGKFVRSFGKEWHTGGHGIDFRMEGSEEFIYFTNTWANPKVVKTNLKGEVVWKLDRPECKEYEKRPDPKDAKKTITPNYNPTNVAFAPDGGFYIGDGYGSHYMLKYSKDAKLVSVFGGAGAADGQFRTPHGNWVDTRDAAKPTLIVCDRANARLQRFDMANKHVSTTEKGTVLFPANCETYKEILLVPDLHARISLFDKNNKLIVHLGEQTPEDTAWRERVVGPKAAKPAIRTQPKEWTPGRFVHPHDACFDTAGNLYCAEWVEGGRITFLKRVG
jgi:hypothetical protein